MLNNNHFEVEKSFTQQIIMIIMHLGTHTHTRTHIDTFGAQTHFACMPVLSNWRSALNEEITRYHIMNKFIT